MQKSIENSPFKKISILSLEGSSHKMLKDYNLLLLLNGSIRIQSSKETNYLDAKDIILLQPMENYTLSGRGNTRLLSVEIEREFFVKSAPTQEGNYQCNSSLDKDRDYTPLQNLLSQIASTYFKNEDFSHLSLYSLAYQLIYYLNCYHFEKSAIAQHPHANSKYSDRLNKITSYINQNYTSDITLSELANHVHLTIPYLSKFFKSNFSHNFNYYLNHVRLTHAVEDLIYTDDSITSIANKNGFASINAFNKLFKEEYNVTPSKYRATNKAKTDEILIHNDSTMVEMDYDEHKLLLQEYIQTNSEVLPKFEFPNQRNIYIKDVHSFKEIKPIWNSMINLGSTLHIAKRDLNKQIALVQNDIGFQYGRIEFIMNDLFLPKDSETEKYSFISFDRAIDILQLLNLTPYLDLSIPYDVLEAKEQNIVSIDIQEYLDMVNALIVHSANTFGIEEVEKWVFEIGFFQNIVRNQSEDVKEFVERFYLTYHLIKKYLPEALVGGISYHVALPAKRFEQILSLFNERKFNPDFVSLSIFPYELTEKNNLSPTEKTAFVFTTDVSYAKHKVIAYKKIMSHYKNLSPKLFINALGPDVRTHSYISDTCFQATYFTKNTIDLLGEVDLLGYYQLSDTAYHSVESTKFLSGHNGIMNQYGIKKPGWMALETINHNGNYLIDRGSNYMITKGRREIYYITLCNYIHISDYHCLNIHKELSIKDAYSIYNEPKTQKISLQLGNMVNGTYQVITYRISKNHGSILDEWGHIGFWEDVARREFDYFKNIVQPKRNYQHMICNEGMLEFNLQLAPHEVVFIEVSLEL